MKIQTFPTILALAVMGLGVSGKAETIYSNLQNAGIPLDFTGLFLDVDGANGWDINPFFGGIGVANSPFFQPVRNGTGDLDRILNLSVGGTVNSGLVFATSNGGADYGGSQDHLAVSAGNDKFVAGQEGYIGFRLNNVGYGWMRVIFNGGNSPAAVIKDWAYDDAGSPIVIGRVEQSAANLGTQTVTLSPSTGEAFSLGSLISDTGGNSNSVIKTGAGETALTANNTYTGLTDVQAGKLTLNRSGGTLPNAGAVQVSGGEVNVAQDDTVGAVTLSSGVISGISTLSGSSYSLTNTGTISANLGNNSAALTKTGSGTAIVSGSNLYSGGTTVSNGTLLVNNTTGSGTGSGNVIVNGGTLGGTGIISGTVTINSTATLSPGASIATFSTGAVTFTNGAIFKYEVNSTSTDADMLKVTGDLNFATTTTILTIADLAASPTLFPENTKFSLVNYTGSRTGGLFTYDGNTLADGSVFFDGLNNWQIDYNATSGGSNQSGAQVAGNFVNITAVPEPTVLMLGGLGLLTFLRRRR